MQRDNPSESEVDMLAGQIGTVSTLEDVISTMRGRALRALCRFAN